MFARFCLWLDTLLAPKTHWWTNGPETDDDTGSAHSHAEPL